MITKDIVLDVEKTRYRTNVGRQGEHAVTAVRIDCTDYIDKYGEGTATLMVKNPCEDEPYAVIIIRDGNSISWVVGNETTINAGKGHAVLIWYPGDSGDAKTADIDFYVEPSSINETAIPLMDLINMINDKLKILTEAGLDPNALREEMRSEIYAFFEENPVQGLEADFVTDLINNYVTENVELLKGPKGDVGDRGPRGLPGLVVPGNGMMSFFVNDKGNLIVAYNDVDEKPSVYIDGDGHLIFGEEENT